MNKFWNKVISLCGITGLGGYIFWNLYDKILSLEIFSELTQTQTFIIILSIIIAVFLALTMILFKGHKKDKCADNSSNSLNKTSVYINNGKAQAMGENSKVYNYK